MNDAIQYRSHRNKSSVQLSRDKLSKVNDMERYLTSKGNRKVLPQSKSIGMLTMEDQIKVSRYKIIQMTDEQCKLSTNLFNRTETSILIRLFSSVAKKNGFDGGMLPLEFRLFLFGTMGITDPLTLDGLCRAAATVTVRGHKKCEKLIHITGYLATLSTLIRGDLESRIALAFEVLDVDTDGRLQYQLEIKHLINRCIDIDNPEPDLADDVHEAHRDFTIYVQHFFGVSAANPLHLEEFARIVRERPWLIDAALPVFPSPDELCSFEYIFGIKDGANLN